MIEFKELVYLFFGFLLGILSTGLTFFFQWLSLRKKIRVGIRAEFEYLCPLLAINALAVIARDSPWNKQLLDWTIERCLISSDQITSNLIELLKKVQSSSDDDLAKIFYAVHIKVSKKESTLKKFRADFLTQNINNLTKLSQTELNALIRIKSNLEKLNEQIDYIMKYGDMTFAQTDEVNHSLVYENLNTSWATFGQMLRLASDEIYNYVQKKNQTRVI